MNKQNLWFLTLFSLILVLGIYYVTMPNELLLGKNESTVKTTTQKSTKKTTVKENSTLEAMRVSLEEERNEQMTALQAQLTSDKITTEEKNNAYEQLKYLNQLQGKEESLEKKIKEKYNLNCFVKIDNEGNAKVTIEGKGKFKDLAICNGTKTSVEIPNTVTSIGRRAFSNNKLTNSTITFPTTPLTIDCYAFDNNLEWIIYPSNVTDVCEN